MSGIVRFKGVLLSDFRGDIQQIRDADVVINKSGTVIKDRVGRTGRRASNNELREAVWVDETEKKKDE